MFELQKVAPASKREMAIEFMKTMQQKITAKAEGESE